MMTTPFEGSKEPEIETVILLANMKYMSLDK